VITLDVRQLPSDSHHKLQFIITGTIPAFANSIRRIILGYVPTLAIDEVIMVENDCALFDEYIAHRLGLIPLNSDVDDLNFQESCDVCNGVGCNACTVTLTLTQETDLGTEMTIYSRDLIPSDHRVYPVVDDVPIMKMGRDQRLILEAVARFGTGKDHAKWQPTASLGFQYMPTVEIRPGSKFTKNVADACPRGVLDYDDKNQSINIKNLLNCNLCMECVQKAEDDSIQVHGDPYQIIFLVESTGALPVENIITNAANILKDYAEGFIESFQLALEEVDNDPTQMKKVSTFERIPLERKEEL
jgi:DNA-directed RNA polymerase subunit D